MASIQSASNQGRYILLEVWEQSTDKDSNTSVVGWKASAKGDWPSSGTWKYVHDTIVKIDGETVYSYYAKPWGSTTDSEKSKFPICKDKSVSGQITVEHNSDGSKYLSFSLETGVLVTESTLYNGSLSLTDFGLTTDETKPVVFSSITGGTLGAPLTVSWIPSNEYQNFRLYYSYGDTEESKYISNDSTDPITAELPLAYDLASIVPNAVSGTIELKLDVLDRVYGRPYTISQNVSFLVPDNEHTKPIISEAVISLTPDPFDGACIQGINSVQLDTLTVSAKYGATIQDCSFRLEGIAYGESQVSQAFVQSGSIPMTVHAADSRGFLSSVFTIDLDVIPYSKPRLKAVQGQSRPKAERCDEDGTLNEKGTWLKILAKREYSPVFYNIEQMNFCSIRYRYRPDSVEGWSDWAQILAEDAAGDEVITQPLLGTLAADVTYLVEIQALDTIGESGSTVITVSTEKVYSHEDGALGSFGFGELVSEADVFSLAQDKLLRVRGQLLLLGDAYRYLLDICHPVGSVLETVNNQDPGDSLGGLWAELETTENTHKWRRTE